MRMDPTRKCISCADVEKFGVSEHPNGEFGLPNGDLDLPIATLDVPTFENIPSFDNSMTFENIPVFNSIIV